MVEEAIIQIKNLSFRYRKDEPYVLQNIDVAIYPGESVSIVGHNGSGKSTLAKFMNALFVPQEGDGEVIVDGLLTSEYDLHQQIRRKIAMVFQNPDNQFVAPTVEDDVAFGLENNGIAYEDMVHLVQESIDIMGLTGLEKQEPHHLSGGQKQRVALAGAVAMRPKILVLDEATSMLDPSGRQEVIEFVQKLQKNEKMTIVSITHDLNEAALSDRVIVMREGQIVKEGKPNEVLSDRDLLIESRLKQPFIQELRSKLLNKGVALPSDIMTEEELVKELCKLKQTT